MNEKTKEQLIKRIKEKKELSGIDDSVVEDFLNAVLKKYNPSEKESDLKIIVSETRYLLRKISGRFQNSVKKRKEHLEKKDFNELLKTHSSTAERLRFYPKLLEIIDAEKPSSILDLGCGLNPIALASSKVAYYASDIKKDELEIIKYHFKKNKIPGKVFFYDLRKIDSTLPEADLVLIFKVFDILGENNHSLTKKIIQELKCRTIIASFATKKLSGKSMHSPERHWFEKILSELKLPYEKVYSDNEVFYKIKKSGHKE
jgi:hypothetical protein